ncbi:MAG: hypothetical protein QOD01_1179 [Actinomycetota bacterium]|nr:hypothetical protein [Actinomycetota bacterium]
MLGSPAATSLAVLDIIRCTGCWLPAVPETHRMRGKLGPPRCGPGSEDQARVGSCHAGATGVPPQVSGATSARASCVTNHDGSVAEPQLRPVILTDAQPLLKTKRVRLFWRPSRCRRDELVGVPGFVDPLPLPSDVKTPVLDEVSVAA